MKKVSLILMIILVLILSSWGISLSKTPTLLTGGLISSVRSLKLPVNIENSLLEKLESVKAKLSSQKEKHFKLSVNNLKAFKNQVEALGGKFLTEKQADVLLRQANNLIELINKTTAKTVGPSGGIVEVRDPLSPIYGAYVSIPSGALDSETLITIVEELSPRPVSTNVVSCGPAVRFGPEGLIFNKPVKIAVPIVEKNCNLFTSDLEGEVFKKVDGVQTNNNLLIGEVNHFSDFQGGSGTGDPDSPYFDWTILLNVTLPTGKMVHMNAHVIHPECTDPSDFYCIPDKIKSIAVTGPSDSGFNYNFVKGDYWFDVYNKTLNEIYGGDRKYHWYYAHKWISGDLKGGEYTFEMTYIDNEGNEKSHLIKRNFTVNPIPIVDRSTVQICRQMDGTGSCLEWSPADLYEGVPLDQPLKVRWDPVFYEGGPVYYQVRISNWNGEPPIYRSNLTTDTEMTIPVELINQILIENATYIMRIWAFDNVTIPNSHNRSRSLDIRFSTGNVSFENYPIFDYARVVRSNFPYINYPFEYNFAARVRIGLNGDPLGGNDVVEVLVYPPNNTQGIEIRNLTGFDFWYVTTDDQEVGKYTFKARLKTEPNKEINLIDYFNKKRNLPIPSNLQFVNNKFSWSPVDGAKTYDLLLEKWVNGNWQRIFTSSFIEKEEFTLPPSLGLGSGNYRWRIRAYDSFNHGTIDNRSNSDWGNFTVQ